MGRKKRWASNTFNIIAHFIERADSAIWKMIRFRSQHFLCTVRCCWGQKVVITTTCTIVSARLFASAIMDSKGHRTSIVQLMIHYTGTVPGNAPHVMDFFFKKSRNFWNYDSVIVHYFLLPTQA